MRKFFNRIQQFIFPTYCALCETYQAEGELLCQACKAELPWNMNTCRQCGVLLTDPLQKTCGACLTKPPYYDHFFSLFQFEEPITTLIHELKFQEKLYHARLFGQLLTEKIATSWYHGQALPNIIIPVPLHKTRLQERGFNQAIEIARVLTKKLNISMDKSSCQRIKATKPQTSLPAKQRANNIKNAFKCTSEAPYAHVALLDDVVTTGGTVNEIARVLKQAGVKKIDVWCCAKTQFIDLI